MIKEQIITTIIGLLIGVSVTYGVLQYKTTMQQSTIVDQHNNSKEIEPSEEFEEIQNQGSFEIITAKIDIITAQNEHGQEIIEAIKIIEGPIQEVCEDPACPTWKQIGESLSGAIFPINKVAAGVQNEPKWYGLMYFDMLQPEAGTLKTVQLSKQQIIAIFSEQPDKERYSQIDIMQTIDGESPWYGLHSSSDGHRNMWNLYTVDGEVIMIEQVYTP